METIFKNKVSMFISLAIFMMFASSAFAIDITSCGNLTSQGNYLLVNNISTGGTQCLTLLNDSISINLNGYSIIGTSVEIGSSGNDDITLFNINVLNEYPRLIIEDGNNILIDDVSAQHVVFYNATNSRVSNSYFVGMILIQENSNNMRIINVTTSSLTTAPSLYVQQNSSNIYFENVSSRLNATISLGAYFMYDPSTGSSISPLSKHNIGWFPADLTTNTADPFGIRNYHPEGGLRMFSNGTFAYDANSSIYFYDNNTIEPPIPPVENNITGYTSQYSASDVPSIGIDLVASLLIVIISFGSLGAFILLYRFSTGKKLF